MQPGYIYILINPSFGKLVKIGKTTRPPEERAAELYQVTGVPTRFFVAHEEPVADCDLAEKYVHKKLERHRINRDREFFDVPLKEAIKVVTEIATSINQIFSTDTSMPETLPSNSKSNTVPIEPRIDRINSVQPVKVKCGKCKTKYVVTLRRYEDFSVCPRCFNEDPLRVKWE